MADDDKVTVTELRITAATGGPKSFLLVVRPGEDTVIMVNNRRVENPDPSWSLAKVIEEAGLVPRINERWVTSFRHHAEDEQGLVITDVYDAATPPVSAGQVTVSDLYGRGVAAIQQEVGPGTDVEFPPVTGSASHMAAMSTATVTAPPPAAGNQTWQPVDWTDRTGRPNRYYPRPIKVLNTSTGQTETQSDVDRIRLFAQLTVANPKVPFHMLLAGPPGGGKSTAVRAALGGNVRSMSFNEYTEESRAIGRISYGTDQDGKLFEQFLMAEALKAWTHVHNDKCPTPCGGAVFVGEEFNMGPPTVNTLFHPLLDGTMVFEYEGREFIQSPDFVFVATANLDAPGGMIAPALWSRLKGRIEFEPSTEAARRVGVRAELCDFTDNLIEKRRNGQRRLQVPGMRDLLAADVMWNTLGEAEGWRQLLSDATGSSQSEWLSEIASRTSAELAKFLERHTTEGRANVA